MQFKRNFWAKIQVPKITSEQLDLLNAEITQREISQVIESIALDKASGPDQLPNEMYKILIDEILPTLQSLFNRYYIQNNMQSCYFNASLVSLILKKDKDPTDINAYRPISLLNSDYKILTTIIAQRIKNILNLLIHKDQVGFMKKRNITFNMRRLQLIINYYWARLHEKNCKINTDLAIVAVDAEKAFDSVTWDHLFTTLSEFGLQGNIKNFIQLIYTNPSVAILVNGIPTPSFVLQKGSRQGCPLSPYLFNLSIEPLAILLRKELDGIWLGQRKTTLLLYADDLLVFIRDSGKNIPILNKIMEEFSAFSGYKPNSTKTEILWLHKTRNSFQNFQFKEVNTSFKYLGIILSKNPNEWYELNYPHLFDKIYRDLSNWSKFQLSLSGKINLIKMMLFPKLLYIMQNVPFFIKKVDLLEFKKRCVRFIWGQKRKAISFKKLALLKLEGGLALPDIELYNVICVGKIALDWINDNEYYTSTRIENQLVTPYALKALLHCSEKELPKAIKDIPVLSNVVRAWQKILKIMKLSLTFSKHLPIAGNPKFTPALNSTIFLRWNRQGLTYIQQLKEKDQYRCKTFAELKRDFNLLDKDFFAYLQIRHLFDDIMKEFSAELDWSRIESVISLYKAGNFSISILYKTLKLYQGQENIEKIAMTWRKSVKDIQKSFKLVEEATISTDLRESHFKIMNKMYITPYLKSKWANSNGLCDKCSYQAADLYHCLWCCPKIKNYWSKIEYWLSKIIQVKFRIQDSHVLFLLEESTGVTNRRFINLVILSGRTLILKYWKSKKAPRLAELIQKVNSYLLLEQFDISVDNEAKIKHFFNKWKSLILSYPKKVQIQMIAPFKGSLFLETALERNEFPRD